MLDQEKRAFTNRAVQLSDEKGHLHTFVVMEDGKGYHTETTDTGVEEKPMSATELVLFDALYSELHNKG